MQPHRSGEGIEYVILETPHEISELLQGIDVLQANLREAGLLNEYTAWRQSRADEREKPPEHLRSYHTVDALRWEAFEARNADEQKMQVNQVAGLALSQLMDHLPTKETTSLLGKLGAYFSDKNIKRGPASDKLNLQR